MAEFDPQGEEKNQAGQCDDSGSCCGGGRARRDENESFVSDWSGAEKKLEAQASAFEASHAEPRAPEAFWVELVRSQAPAQDAGLEAQSTELVARGDTAAGVQSERFWADLVRSQQPGGQSRQFWQDLVSSQQTGSSSSSSSASPIHSSLSNPPTGMGWSDGEASEWSPPERNDERQYEPVEPAGEPLEIEASARREDVAWTVPASSEQDWASARSEGLHFEPSADGKSLMAAAVEAAQRQAKAKKTVAKKPAAKKAVVKKAAAKAKKPAAKKPAVKKTVKAKKVVAKKPAKKVVKKPAPSLKIIKAPTRRAA